jgi:hypothetical protein
MSMRGMDRLLDLQATDSSMDRLEHRRGQLEAGEDLAIARKQMEDAESRLGELRLALDSVAAQSSRFEHDIDSMGRKLDDEQKRMYDGSIANAKELGALQHEITNLKERRSRTEDELLELMVRREDMDARASKATEEVAAARARVDEVGGDAARELDDIARNIDELRATRSELASQIDEELLELYDDLRRQKKGIGAAAIVDGVCQACHEKLSAMELDRLKRDDGIKRCEYCRRIVVFA